MLSKHIYNDGFKKIPYTGDVYELDCQGVLRETVSKREVPPTAITGEWFDDLDRAVLMAYVHRNCRVPTRLVKGLSVLFKDGNTGNSRLTNTVWQCPRGQLVHPLYPGFCYIPGFSRYLINEQGEVLSPGAGKLLSPYTNADGYLMFGLQPDVGGRTIIGRHRLLALAWLDYDSCVDKLDVNHLNSCPGDDRLENLEWATRKRNVEHAHTQGNTNAKAVKVRDIVSGEITQYHSIAIAARELGVGDETVRQRILKGRDGRVFDGLQFKASDDATPWLSFDNLDDYRWTNRPYVIEVKKLYDDTPKRFSQLSRAAEYMQMNVATLRYHLAKATNVVVNEFFLEMRFEKSAQIERSE